MGDGGLTFLARKSGRLPPVGAGDTERSSAMPGGFGVTTTKGDQPPGDAFRDLDSTGGERELSMTRSGPRFKLGMELFWMRVGEGGEGERVRG